MDIDKASRVRSYVHAQLAFVPFYSADLLDPGDSALGLQTPVLTARNPLVTVQPGPALPSASARLGVQGSRGSPTQVGSVLGERPAEIQKKRLVKHLRAGERKRPLKLNRDARETPDPDSLNKSAKEYTPTKKERKRRREKPKFPTGLSFLYGFAPKNVGPSRLTVSRLNTL